MGEPQKEFRRLGRYSLLRKIATGGMGEVHLARLDSVQGVERLFAIKLLLPQFAEEQSVVDMFVTEARIAARIAHTNVCQVFELGLENEELFIAMEYLRGVPATSILKTHKPLNPVATKIAVAIVKQAAAGLQFAHDLRDENGESLDVVHRDISPGNIFITTGGTAKVLDFGVVKAKDSSHKTKTGALKGKFGYMSPEQIMAEPLDSRSDIFSLGIVLFELLTNRRLFTRDSEYGTLKAITESPIPTLASFRPDLPAELGGVLAKALARDLDERYATMKEFSQAITDAMKNYGGVADSAEIGDYIQSKFTYQLGEIDAMLQEVRRLEAPSERLLAQKRPLSGETTQVLKDGISSSDLTVDADNAEELSSTGAHITEDVVPLAGPGKRGSGMAIAVGLVGIGVVALAAVLLLRGNDPAPVAAGIVYEGQLSPENGATDTVKPATGADVPAVQDAGSASAADASEKATPAVKDPKTPSKPVSKGHRCESKSSAEAKNRCYVASEGRKLTKCLQEHASGVSGAPKLTLNFDLQKSGKVAGVTVSPPHFASTALGSCVKSVAQKIKFGPQGSSVRFRIPLKINQK